MSKKISKKEIEFAKEYAEHGNASKAFRSVFGTQGLSPQAVGRRAAALSNTERVQACVERLKKQQEKNAEFGIAEIVKEWQDIATADPNELMSIRRRCCRHCYGRGHHYQWTDADEFAYAVGVALGTPKKGEARKAIPSDAGGYGFNFTLRPHPECPQCRGEGHEITYFSDTRELTGKARKLYAGIKQTTNGITIVTRDQDAALANLARFYGMFTDKIQLQGAGGGPLISATVPLPADPVEAANLYAELIKSNARE
jgi:phage terminase small subunit